MGTGIQARHPRNCRFAAGGRCNCKPSYEASVFSVRDAKKIRRSFPTEAAVWIDGAKAGTILTRSQRPYKPAVLRGIEANLTRFVFDDLGGRKVSHVTRRDVQALVDRLTGEGRSGSTVRNVVVALKVVYRRLL